MEELRSINVALIRDRGTLKLRVNLIKKNVIFGWLKPADNF